MCEMKASELEERILKDGLKKKAREEMLRGSQVPSDTLLADEVAKLTSERDALLSALDEIVREAFDCEVTGEEYCSHDCVQSMVISLLLQHGRMVPSDTKGWFKFVEANSANHMTSDTEKKNESWRGEMKTKTTIAIAFALTASTLLAQTNETIKSSDYVNFAALVCSSNIVSIISESVEIVTNVVPWNDEERSPLRSTLVLNEPMPGSITKEATQKTETTTVVEVKTLRFKWDGVEREVKNERVMSSKVKRWNKKQEWVEEGKQKY